MVLIGLGVGYFLRKNIAEGKLNQAEQEAARIIANGERTAESKKKEALLEAKEEFISSVPMWNEKIKIVVLNFNVWNAVFFKKKNLWIKN